DQCVDKQAAARHGVEARFGEADSAKRYRRVNWSPAPSAERTAWWHWRGSARRARKHSTMSTASPCPGCCRPLSAHGSSTVPCCAVHLLFTNFLLVPLSLPF